MSNRRQIRATFPSSAACRKTRSRQAVNRTCSAFVIAAMAGDADVLVTGDGALRKLGKRAPLPIVSPRGLWEMFRGVER